MGNSLLNYDLCAYINYYYCIDKPIKYITKKRLLLEILCVCVTRTCAFNYDTDLCANAYLLKCGMFEFHSKFQQIGLFWFQWDFVLAIFAVPLCISYLCRTWNDYDERIDLRNMKSKDVIRISFHSIVNIVTFQLT